MVLVPFAAAGEDEQQRAPAGSQRWASPSRSTSATLTAGESGCRDRPIAAHGRGPTPADWAFDGAARSAEIVTALVAERAGDA